jgi:hypothetical protein
VYRFKDDIKGVVFKAVLKDVVVEGDWLVIVASLIRLIAAVAAWLGGLALVVLGAAWFLAAHGRAERSGAMERERRGNRSYRQPARVFRAVCVSAVPKALLRQMRRRRPTVVMRRLERR